MVIVIPVIGDFISGLEIKVYTNNKNVMRLSGTQKYVQRAPESYSAVCHSFCCQFACFQHFFLFVQCNEFVLLNNNNNNRRLVTLAEHTSDHDLCYFKQPFLFSAILQAVQLAALQACEGAQPLQAWVVGPTQLLEFSRRELNNNNNNRRLVTLAVFQT